MTYRAACWDMGLLPVASLLCLRTATAQSVYDVAAGLEIEVNSAGTAFTSLGNFSPDTGIMCYQDWSNAGGCICNVLTLASQNTVSAKTKYIVNANETNSIKVAPLSATNAIVCYSDKGNTKHATCNALTLSGTGLSVGEDLVVNSVAEEVAYIALARLSANMAVLCYSDTTDASYGWGLCSTLSLSGGVLSKGNDYFLNVDGTFTSHISVVGFSETAAVVCYSGGGHGTCNVLSLTGEASPGANLTKSTEVVFIVSPAEDSVKYISVARFSDTSGVVCYAEGGTLEYAKCNALNLQGTLFSIGTATLVNSAVSTYVSVAPISATAGLVCYADWEGSAAEYGFGTCNVVGLDGDVVTAGPAKLLNSDETAHVALTSLSTEAALLCYSDVGAGHGKCAALSIAETTTTTTSSVTTSTTSTTTITTVTGTSSTTAHTTSETSTVTATSTTSPHSTTDTTLSSSATTQTGAASVAAAAAEGAPSSGGERVRALHAFLAGLLAATVAATAVPAHQ